MTELRLLSYNVHGLRDDQYALHGLVRDLDPDVMCVQEAPKYLRWRSRVAALARECGLFYVSGGGTTGGTALLVHLRVAVERRAELALSSRFGWPDRGVAAAVIRVRGARLGVASLHLPLVGSARLGQARRALEVLRLGGASTLLAAGDLNERPSGAVWSYLHQQGLRDLGHSSGPTYPAIHPDRRIDGAFATSDVEVLDFRVVDDPRVRRASDHRPLLVTLRVPTV
jgi:endonuclease/exonuclease/phosphatase family metal-dependent hydrolase